VRMNGNGGKVLVHMSNCYPCLLGHLIDLTLALVGCDKAVSTRAARIRRFVRAVRAACGTGQKRDGGCWLWYMLLTHSVVVVRVVRVVQVVQVVRVFDACLIVCSARAWPCMPLIRIGIPKKGYCDFVIVQQPSQKECDSIIILMSVYVYERCAPYVCALRLLH
jgi:hypothetical protein